MATKTQFLTYYIVLTDAAAVADYQTQYPIGVNRAITPNAADVEFSAPFRGYSDPGAGAPYIWTPWSGFGESDGPYPLNVATFQRKSGGFLGIGGTTTRYYWIGAFQLAASSTPVSPTTGEPPAVYATIPRRRWIVGFESAGDEQMIQSGLGVSRDASRHKGGLGCAFRGGVNTTISVTVGEHDPTGAYTSAKSWERLYFRLRNTPTTGTVPFWRCGSFPSDAAGIQIGITPGGQIAIFNKAIVGTLTLLTTVGSFTPWSGSPDENAWHRLDMLIEFNAAASGGNGVFRMYIDGVLEATLNVPAASGGFGGNSQRHQRSELGSIDSSSNDLGIDLDDWICSEIPHIGGVENLNSRDWLLGSKIVRLQATAFGSGHNAVGWPGDYRVLRQRSGYNGNTTSNTTLASTTTAAVVCEVETDSDQMIDAESDAIGVASLRASVTASKASGTNAPSAGYTLAGGAAVDRTISIGTTKSSDGSALWSGPQAADFQDVTPVKLRYIKTNDAVVNTLHALDGEAELIGMWGPEDFVPTADQPTAPDFPRLLGHHNAWYPRSPWANDGISAPIAPYFIHLGTYVGNGTVTELQFRAPIHFLFVRNVTAGGASVFMTSQDLWGHEDFQQGVSPQLTEFLEDLTFVPGVGEDVQSSRYLARIVGSSARSNALGVTYQYVAIGDPGQRFMTSLEIEGKSSGYLASGLVAKLYNADFLPEFAILHGGDLSGNTSTHSLLSKSSGDATASVRRAAGAEVTNALTFGTGQVTTQSALHSIGVKVTALFLRRHDGNDDPGEAGVFSIGSYTGDGASSRTLQVGTAGKRPVFAIIFGSTGSWRDPSHTSTNASNISGGTAQAGTAITAGGIDSITIGSAVNSNGNSYNYFILWGSTTAGNNGWGVNGEYIPVEANSPGDGPWPSDPDEDDYAEQPEPEPTPETPDDITTDLAADCVEFTTATANIALSRLGITKRIDDLSTALTLEAEQVRLHYGLVVGEVLRAFDWPFATRYADLVLEDGDETTNANRDWIYSYRAPAGMVKARRIAGQSYQRRGHDPDPIEFRVGSDTTGGLIFANEPASSDVPLTLEYTARVSCPARMGDPLFRSALAWKLAAAIAPGLSRSDKWVAYCESKYAEVLRSGETVAANEVQQEPGGDAPWHTGRN